MKSSKKDWLATFAVACFTVTLCLSVAFAIAKTQKEPSQQLKMRVEPAAEAKPAFLDDRDAIFWGWRFSHAGAQFQIGLHTNGSVVWRNVPDYLTNLPAGWLSARPVPTNSPHNFNEKR